MMSSDVTVRLTGYGSLEKNQSLGETESAFGYNDQTNVPHSLAKRKCSQTSNDMFQGQAGHKEIIVGQDSVDDNNESTDWNKDNQPLLKGNSSPYERGRFCASTNLYIYISHFLSAWGDNMWTFAVGVFLVEIDEDTLQLTAFFGLTMGVCTLLLGPIIGDWVDTMPRLRAAQEALILQNVMIALCAGFIYNLLEFQADVQSWGEWAPICHYIMIILLGTGAYLAHIANIIAIERDWVVEICEQDEDKLATMSSAMRAIDLLAMIVAPIATGQVMTVFSSKIGALAIAGWNVASFVLEYFLLWKVYTSVPALQKEKNIFAGSDTDKKDTPTRIARLFSGVTIIVSGWRTYIGHAVALSGFSLALLYMTVLGFDNVTIGYAKMQCLSEFEVGLMMGAAGLVGAAGTITYPVLRRCLGLPWTAMLALTLQSATLSMCVVSVWLPGSPFDLGNPDRDAVVCEANSTTPSANLTSWTTSPSTVQTTGPDITSVVVLMAGIIAARFGLWIADLAITQMFLETVVENERGIVNGVQQSLNQFMDLVKFVLVVILPRTTQFGLLIILSYSFVFSGWGLYLVFLVKVPKELFQKKTSIDV